MSWLSDHVLPFFQRFCVNVIKCGPIPKHVAIIMDGNRRFAAKSNSDTIVGHSKGFDKLTEVLQWCAALGISEVTIYAFSTENFKRSKAEIDSIMDLAAKKFQSLLDEIPKVMEVGLCVRIIGDLSLIPHELRRQMAAVMLKTKDNNKKFLNIAFAYTSREEMVNAMKTVNEGVKKGLIHIDDIDEDLISDCLLTADSPDPEIILRTSGETRFSDFLLWQISDSYICFLGVLWPEISFWQFLVCILNYQRGCSKLMKPQSRKQEKNDRVKKFLETLQQQKVEKLKSYLS